MLIEASNTFSKIYNKNLRIFFHYITLPITKNQKTKYRQNNYIENRSHDIGIFLKHDGYVNLYYLTFKLYQ